MKNDNPTAARQRREPLIKRVARVLFPLITTTVTLQPLAYAAPSPSLLSQQPRFVDLAVDSNVAFIMDDSLSMEDIRLPVPAGLDPGESTGGTVTVRGAASGYSSGAWVVGGALANVNRRDEWIYRSSRLNPLYYNPAITYKPWNDNGRDGASGNFLNAAVGTTSAVTDGTTGFRFGVTPQDMRYAGPNYVANDGANGNNYNRRLTTTGANPPPVPASICGNIAGDPAWPGFCRNRPIAGGFDGVTDTSATPRNQDLFTSPLVAANGGPQQCTVTPTSPTSSPLPSVARGSTPQPSSNRSTSARPSTAVPTSARTDTARSSTPRPQTARATQTRPSVVPTTTAANITTIGSAPLSVTTRATQPRTFSAPPATTNRTFQARPSTTVTATTNRTTQARPSTTLQSPITRTVTSRVTEYRYETGVCGSGSFSAWSTTAPGTNYCSNPTSEGVSVSKIETRQSACPSGSSVDPGNSNQCLSDCPSGTSASGNQCVYSCPSGTTLIGGQCYSACPGGFSIDSNATQCISNCPSGTTATATQCVGSCPSGQNLISGQCYSACPSGYAIDGAAGSSTQCVSNCPSGTTATATQCVGGTCPSGTTLISGQCYNACPSGWSVDTNTTQCIQNCPTGATTVGNTCEACPGGFPNRNGSTCYANCAGTVNPSNPAQCLNCSAGTLNASTAQCTNVCPAGSNLIGGQCYTACPAGFAINGSAATSTQCIQTCPAGQTQTATQCLDACPAGFPNLRTSTQTTCYADCPGGTTVVGTNNNTNFALCRTNCPSGYTATSSTLCTGTCAGGENLISSQCYGACGAGSTIDGNATSSTQCISDCPAGTTTSGSQCLSACPAAFPSLSGSTCYADCPATHPTVNPSNAAQCLGTCPAGTTQSGNQCQSCAAGETLLSSGQCCPSTATTAGNCPVNRPPGYTCAAGTWVPDLDKPAPARYYVFAPATAVANPTAAQLSDPANYIRVEINRDRTMDYPKASTRTDCTGSICTWDEEAQNFANWFTYYRTRLASAISVSAESLSGLTRAQSLDGLRLAYGSINYFPNGANPYADPAICTSNATAPGCRLRDPILVDGIDTYGALVRGVRPFTQVGDASINPASVPAPGSNDPRQEVFDWLFSLRAIASTPNREALDSVGRYFQSSAPTGPWIQPVDPANWTSTEDPADHISCRRNYTIVITDGEWTNQPATNPPQQPLVESRGTTLNALSTSGPTITGLAGRTYTYNPATEVQFSTNASGSGQTLSDIAFNYWSRDLRTDLTNNIRVIDPTSGSQGDPAFWQHMTPYLIGYGISSSMDTPSARSAIAASAITPQAINWPSVNLDPLTITDRDRTPDQPVNCAYDASANPSGCGRVDDTFRAAMAARGDFLAAADVGKLSQGVAAAFTAIGQIEGSATSLTGRSGTLQTGDRLFAASFRTNVWTGRVQSFDAVDYFQGLSTGTTPPSIDSRFPAPASRNMLTSSANGTAVTFPTGSADFTNLSVAQRLLLANDPTVAAWLRGDQSLESRNGGNFRSRPAGEVMGSIVNSQPFYSKAPDFGYQSARKPAADASSGNAYRDYVNLNKQYRPARIYVGSNDGMLHAFDVSGTPATNANYMNEVFAYVPRASYAGLLQLTSPTYTHRYLVDGPVVEGDVYTSGAWRTVIVGTTGAGPKGIFAIDATQRSGSSATTVGTGNVLWDITGADTATNIEHVGHILQPGVIGSGKDGEWYYFVGNGYESQNDKAKLLAVRIRDGSIFAIDTDSAGGPTPADPNVDLRPNGLGGVTPVYDANRNIVAIYGGDRLGRLWKFDLSNTNRGSWNSTLLFTAENAAGIRQPITAAPRVIPHPLGGRVVVAGTGRIFERTDLADLSVQSVYGIWEKNTSSPTTVAKASLRQFALVDQTSSTGERFRQLTGTSALNWATDNGWYFNLVAGAGAVGERVVASPSENFGFANVTSFEPSADGDPCLGGGRSFFYRLDVAGSFTRAPFAPISGLPAGVPQNTVVGSELSTATVNQLQTLLRPVTGTTDTSTTLTQTQTGDLANRTANAATNPCLSSQAGGQSLQGTAVSSPTLSCPVTPLRVWREIPRGPR